MSTVKKIKDFGQSIWYDNIRRDLLQSGAFDKMVQDDGVTGLTSNPSIFHQAIAGTSLYDSAIKELGHHGLSAYEIYEQIAIDDLRAAADILAPVYMQTNRTDSYVSLEVSPNLAHDTEGTILEARLLFTRVGRPNLMIKIPATEEGIPAIEELIENGINVNVTLLFSVERYEQVVEAYLKGLERRLAAGHPIDSVSSVASFFVSRVDTAMDKLIEERLKDPNHHQILEELLGQTAIANAKIAYLHSKKLFSSERFKKLVEEGAKVQRLLWASTSTKNEKYRDVRYVEELIGANTVNTVPPKTLALFREHGVVNETLTKGAKEAEELVQHLNEEGLSLHSVTTQLEEAGVEAFASSFKELLASVEAKL